MMEKEEDEVRSRAINKQCKHIANSANRQTT
jgi:hypothetical protein